MQYSAAKFANQPERFRDVFSGMDAQLVDGTQKPVSEVTDDEVRSYLVDGVVSPEGEWVGADAVVVV